MSVRKKMQEVLEKRRSLPEIPGWRVKSQEQTLDIKIESKLPALVSSRSEINKKPIYPHWNLSKGTTYTIPLNKNMIGLHKKTKSQNNFSNFSMSKAPNEYPIKTFYLMKVKTSKLEQDDISRPLIKNKNDKEMITSSDSTPYRRKILVIEKGEEINCNKSTQDLVTDSNMKFNYKGLERPRSKSQLIESYQKNDEYRNYVHSDTQFESEFSEKIDFKDIDCKAKDEFGSCDKNFDENEYKIKDSDEKIKEIFVHSVVFDVKINNVKYITSRSETGKFLEKHEKDAKVVEENIYSSTENSSEPNNIRNLIILGSKRLLSNTEDTKNIKTKENQSIKSSINSQHSLKHNEISASNFNQLENPKNIDDSSHLASNIVTQNEDFAKSKPVILSISTIKLPLIVKQSPENFQSLNINQDEKTSETELLSQISQDFTTGVNNRLQSLNPIIACNPYSLNSFKMNEMIEEQPSYEEIEVSTLVRPELVSNQKFQSSNPYFKQDKSSIPQRESTNRDYGNHNTSQKNPQKESEIIEKPYQDNYKRLNSAESKHHKPKAKILNQETKEIFNESQKSKEFVESPIIRSLRRTKSLVPTLLSDNFNKKPLKPQEEKPIIPLSKSQRKPVPFHKSKTTAFDPESSDSFSNSSESAKIEEIQINPIEQPEITILPKVNDKPEHHKKSKSKVPDPDPNFSQAPASKKPKKSRQARKSQILIPIIPQIKEDLSELTKHGQNLNPDALSQSKPIKSSKNNQKLQNFPLSLQEAKETREKKDKNSKKNLEYKSKPTNTDLSLNDQTAKKIPFTDRQARQRASIRVEVRDFNQFKKQGNNEKPKRKQHKKRSTYNSSVNSSEFAYDSQESDSPAPKNRNYDRILFELNHPELLKKVENAEKVEEIDEKKEENAEEEVEKNESSCDSIDVDREIGYLTRNKHFSMNNLAFNAAITCRFAPKEEFHTVANVNEMDINEFNVDHENLEFHMMKKRFLNGKRFSMDVGDDDFYGRLEVLDLEQWLPGEYQNMRMRDIERRRRMIKMLKSKSEKVEIGKEVKYSFSNLIKDVKNKGFRLKGNIRFAEKIKMLAKNVACSEDLDSDEKIYMRIKGAEEFKKIEEKEMNARELLKSIKLGMEKLEAIYK